MVHLSAIEAAIKKIDYFKGINSDTILKYMKSKVSLWDPQLRLSPNEKYQAYLAYSEKLLDDYYDINKDNKVTVEEFAQKEKEACMRILGDDVEKYTDDEREEIYSKVIDSLNKDENSVKAYDKNGDGKIDKGEVVQAMKDNNISMPESHEEFCIERTINLFAGNIDINNDGIVSREELALFNKEADEMGSGNADGVISALDENAIFDAVIGKNAKDEAVKAVVEKYINGELLTEEENKILAESRKTIRTNLGKRLPNFEL